MNIQTIFQSLETGATESTLDPNKVYLHHVVLAMYSIDDIDFDRIDVADTFDYANNFEFSVGLETDDGNMHFTPDSLVGNLIAISEFVDKLLRMPKSPQQTRHFL